MSGKPNKKNEVGSLMKTASRRLGGGKSTPLNFVYSKTANAIHKKVDVHDKSKNAIHISVDDAESIIAMLDWLKYMMCQECGKRCECDNRCIVARKAEQIIKNLRSKI